MSEKFRAGIEKHLQQQRRRRAEGDFAAFTKLHLREHLEKKPSRFHEWLFEELNELPQQQGQRIAVAAPRGHAKSTVVSLGYVLWSVLTGRDRFVFIVSATQPQAEQHLRNLKEQIHGNRRLLSDFPDICAPPGEKPQPKLSRREQIELPNGAAIRALGAGQQFRGIRHGRHRPSLIVVDDLEEAEAVLQETQREKLQNWFFSSLLNAGTPETNVVMVGTVMHHDALLARLLDPERNPGWRGHRFKAIERDSDHPELWDRWEAIYRGRDPERKRQGPEAARRFFWFNSDRMLEGTRVLWPAQEGYHTLREMRLTQGRLSFAAEKQNEPINPAECVFDAGALHFWDDGETTNPATLLESLGRDVIVCGACDPGLGTGGDYTALVTVAYVPESRRCYVLEADIAQRAPHATIERVVELSKLYRYDQFVVEANHFQSLLVGQLKEALRRDGRPTPVEEAKHTRNKVSRIQGLEPMLSGGHLMLSRRQETLIGQLERFPHGAHDDGPDALEMAVRHAPEARKHCPPVPQSPRMFRGIPMRELMDFWKKTDHLPSPEQKRIFRERFGKRR